MGFEGSSRVGSGRVAGGRVDERLGEVLRWQH